MGAIVWIIIGVVAGWLACRITHRSETVDYLLNIGFGVLGAFVGGFATNLVIYRPVFQANLQSILVAALASFVFVVVLNAARR